MSKLFLEDEFKYLLIIKMINIIKCVIQILMKMIENVKID